ncbi:MAG: hypothetical protein H0V30_09195 [Chitinophagaceae bacterium]|jgi:F0F1-type ATP synthase assembly protein I|nr:hypothetical protein [Chitinophagaceae bacterium]
MNTSKPDRKRANFAFIAIVIAGYLLGFLIKRVPIGLIIGLVLGIFASMMIRRRQK